DGGAGRRHPVRLRTLSSVPLEPTLAATQSAAATLFRVLKSNQGRYSLWPAAKATPAGWNEALAASSKTECLAFIGRAWTRLRVRPAPLAFSLMFFGGDEGQAAQDQYRTVIEA